MANLPVYQNAIPVVSASRYQCSQWACHCGSCLRMELSSYGKAPHNSSWYCVQIEYLVSISRSVCTPAELALTCSELFRRGLKSVFEGVKTQCEQFTMWISHWQISQLDAAVIMQRCSVYDRVWQPKNHLGNCNQKNNRTSCTHRSLSIDHTPFDAFQDASQVARSVVRHRSGSQESTH